MKYAKGGFKRILAIRLEPGDDVVESIRLLCLKENIKHGVIFTALGSLKKASFYDPTPVPGQPGKYRYGDPIEMEGAVELITLSGIVCEEDSGSISLHIHAAFADEMGNGYAGHLEAGNITFATVELFLGELEGIRLHRSFDESLGVMLSNPVQV